MRALTQSEIENEYLGGDLAILMREAKEEFQNKVVSDIVDDEGNQYVDLVLGGGGVLGIALVGYTYLLEEMGIRFLHLGGTSAGSINAMLLAALGESGRNAPPQLQQKKSGRMLHILATMDMQTFVDGGKGVQDLVDSWVAGRQLLLHPLELMSAAGTLGGRLGLCPGDAFHGWLKQILDSEGVSSIRQLRKKRGRRPAGFRMRDGSPATDTPDGLAQISIVAADISTRTKVEFPKMAPLYWSDPDRVNPADFVRASMSIPFFYRPFVVTGIPREPSEKVKDAWNNWAGYDIDGGSLLPDECAFVDGGIMSNFPIDLFHDTTRVPSRPTFGVKLGTDKRLTRHFNKVSQLALTVFDSARHTLDYDFLARNPDYQSLVESVDVEDFSWLDFHMSDERKMKLFYLGAKAAQSFLRRFNWDGYKDLRRLLAEAGRASIEAGKPKSTRVSVR